MLVKLNLTPVRGGWGTRCIIFLLQQISYYTSLLSYSRSWSGMCWIRWTGDVIPKLYLSKRLQVWARSPYLQSGRARLGGSTRCLICIYGKQASQFVQEVSKWAQSQGIRPDHFEENMRRCIGMSLMKSNCDLMSRAAYVQGTLRGNRWTRANTRQRTATAMMMQFDIDTQIPHAGVAHRWAMGPTLVTH